MFEVQGGVEVVPTKHLERGQIVIGVRLREVCEANLPFFALTIIGDEE